MILSGMTIIRLFLIDELIGSIVDSTNKYVQLMKQVPAIKIKIMNNPRSVYNLWNDVNEDEIWCYFSIQLLMGIIHKPYYHKYWSKESLLSTPIFSTMMKRDRFEYITKILHFVDPLGVAHNKLLCKLEALPQNTTYTVWNCIHPRTTHRN